jgi:pimeloyl-ACP methyl ester carboxylesterase
VTTTVAEEPLLIESTTGVPIACWRSGSGPPLVLVHGTGEDHTRWSPVLPQFGARFTVHAIDRRGRAASGDAERYSVSAEAADIASVVDHLGPGVSVLAHSYGAICALEAAPNLAGLRKLVLYEPPLPVEGSRDLSDLAAALRRMVDGGDHEQALCAFLTDVVGVSTVEADLLRGVPGFRDRAALAPTLHREIESTRDYVFTPSRFRGLRTPTLLLAGGESRPALRRAVALVDASLPGSRVAVLDGQAHRAMDTGPRQFLDTVLRFLDDDTDPHV